MKLARAVATAPKAAERTVTLEPSAYATTWKKAPKGAEKVGLRLLGLDEITRARSIASDVASKKHPNPEDRIQRLDAWHDSFQTTLVARGTCSPHNVDAPFWPGAEDNVPVMLRPEAIRFLRDAIDQYADETSPQRRPATDDEIAELVARLGDPKSLPALDTIESIRCRKRLAYVLDELRATDPTE